MNIRKFLRLASSSRTSLPKQFKPDEVSDLIGYHFRTPAHLQLALTHRSFVRSQSEQLPSNERLEFLGDSVLGLVIANRLFEDFPNMSEGDLTKLKALLVNETTLAAIGKKIDLNRHVLLSPEEERSGGRERTSIISDTFEAVIGAVFLDGGFNAAADVVLRLIYVQRDAIMADTSQRNYKGELLELVQGRSQGMPRYDVVAEEGPDHDKIFRIEVSVNGQIVGRGEGSSKKEAEQGAARQALNRLSYQE